MQKPERFYLFRLEIGQHPDRAELVYIFKHGYREVCFAVAADHNQNQTQYHYWVTP